MTMANNRSQKQLLLCPQILPVVVVLRVHWIIDRGFPHRVVLLHQQNRFALHILLRVQEFQLLSLLLPQEVKLRQHQVQEQHLQENQKVPPGG